MYHHMPYSEFLEAERKREAELYGDSETWEPRDTNPDVPWSFPLPFIEFAEGVNGEVEWGAGPKTLAELRMYALSWAIRSKPGWRHKILDQMILEKWRKEALEQQEPLPLEEKMTINMVNYVLTELEGYSAISDDDHGFEVGCFDSIWYSDRAIPEELLQRLKTGVQKFENVPEEQKDWHPGSSGQVLDLVHPSMYCVRYARTPAFIPGAPRTAANLLLLRPPDFEVPGDQPWMLSDKFSWLPSDFKVQDDGAVHLVSPYINNIHPEHHQPLYRAVEDVLTVLMPMFERVLSGIVDRSTPTPGGGRIQLNDDGELTCLAWGGSEDDGTTINYENLPDSYETYTGALEEFSPISLRGRTIQCIVKLANIHLTPEKPEYPGGSWHVEGMLNESIVASGIYYYDEENITESKLAFRVAVGQPPYHEQYDTLCMKTLYNITAEEACVQDIGSIDTKSGRLLTWPNIYLHCVSPFRLLDPSKPGHRKILAIFLVDPTVKIASTTDVPPQQAEWAAEALFSARDDPASFMSRLPSELCNLVVNSFPSSVMNAKEADSYRAELMKERTSFVKSHNREVFGATFNMCEH
ncbi:hypothetical protein C8R44DRAFT_755899 [Mycena epipterygia]|nr:hypothetical protein C8R44DRAFT_755899 [Mycena epipterygia]